MEFDQVRVKKTNYDHDSSLNLYMTPPFGQLTLEECEDLGRQRFEALSIIERNPPELNNELRKIKSDVYKTNCITLNRHDKQQHKLDHFSHMLARLYCIHRPELWNWFKVCERKLLHHRLKDIGGTLSGGQLEAILTNFNFNFQRVIGSELLDLYKEKLIGWQSLSYHAKETDIFKVKFVDALKFIGRRSVALKDGYAFLTKNEIISVVCDVFERHLDEELNYARRHLNIESVQVSQLIQSLDMVYMEHQEKIDEEKNRLKKDSAEYSNNPYKIDLDDIDTISKTHFPPCMRHLHDSLVEDSHLKHYGRLYYGTFLKAGGVDVESHTDFFRTHFTKKMTNERFDREHKYNIRHWHGKEGHKKSLSCFSCDKIINYNPPGPQDKHGCVFKHFDDNHLKTLMKKHGVQEVDIESILSKRNEKESVDREKVACSLYFKAMKGEEPSEIIRNPVQYYRESMNHMHRPKKIEEDGDKMIVENVEDDKFDDDDEELMKAVTSQ